MTPPPRLAMTLLALIPASPLLAQSMDWVAVPETVAVGDTVLLLRDIAVAPNVEWQVRALEASRTVEPLTDPLARYAESRLTVAYRVAAFAPGRIPVVMPDLEVVHPDGDIEVIVGDTAWVQVRSVLPAADSLLEPMPALDPIERRRRTTSPLAMLAGTVLLLVVTWGWLRKRARSRTQPDEWEEEETMSPPLDTWVAAGELRAVATVATDRLRSHLARAVPGAGRHLATEEVLALLERQRPEWPLREVGGVLRALERARFAPAIKDDLLSLVDQARSLEDRLVELETAESAEVSE
ncbi:MAG: hypothetical protein ACE5PT_04560 [Gemmatimonadales bacterium]